MVQYALDALVLEDVTFDLSFLSKCSLNSLLCFIVNSSNNMFTMRISNSSPPFSTHTLSNTAFFPLPCLETVLARHSQTLFLSILVHSLWHVYHLLLSYLAFSLYKIACSLLMSSASLPFPSCFCHILYKSTLDFFPTQEGTYEMALLPLDLYFFI